MGNEDSDSDYNVEEYIRPTTVSKPLKNGESEDLLGNFKEIAKDQKEYQQFPKEVFQDDYDHDQKFDVEEESKKKVKEKSTKLKKKIRKKVMAKIGRERMKKAAASGS